MLYQARHSTKYITGVTAWHRQTFRLQIHVAQFFTMEHAVEPAIAGHRHDVQQQPAVMDAVHEPDVIQRAGRRSNARNDLERLNNIRPGLNYNGLYMSSATYKQTNRNCDDTIQLTDGRFCTVACCAVGTFSCRCVEACYWAESVAVFVMPLH